MSRTIRENASNYDCAIEMGHKYRPMIQTLTGAMSIDRDCPTLLVLDPGGASRNVTLPVVEPLFFWIVNTADAAEDLVLKNQAATTIVTISQNEIGCVICDGVNWYGGMMPKT